MIEIKAKLVRAESAIFATGELVECLIEVTHRTLGGNDNSTNANSSKNVENLAWSSVQLHCYRKTSFSVSPIDKTAELTELIGKTTLDSATQTHGNIVFATKPKILFCDLKLKPGDSKIYFFNEFIPRDAPPTYRGYEIKYFYKITIAAQRVKSKVQTLTVPIRVLPIPKIARPEELTFTEETNDELTPTNPFLDKREISELETSWNHIKNLTARRAPKFYRISNKHGYVGRFCIFKSSYKLGEDIVGSLDFANSKVRCVQFSVKLQSQENLVHKISNPPSSNLTDSSSVNSLDLASVTSGSVIDNLHKSRNSNSANEKVEEDIVGKITSHTTNHQVCYAMLQTQVVVPIPLHVSPNFHTDLVDVKWRLHFEFVTSTMMDFGKVNPEVGELTAPAEIPVETMGWNLPVTIYATNPLQIYAPSQTYSLLIK